MSIQDHSQPSLFRHGRITPLPDDITLTRSRGADTSIEANKRVAKESDRAKVLEIIAANPTTGATLKEIAAAMGREKNCVSGRCSELLALKEITYFKDERREGCRVYYVR